MTKYTREEALNASSVYFNGDELASSVFVDKYALRNAAGEFLELHPSHMHRRLAKEFARIEAKYPNPMSEDEIFGYFDRWEIVPQGSPMSAIGNPYKIQSLSNCFVIESPEDSYGGIMFTDQEQAQIMKRRGGVGFDISTLRPRGMNTANAAGTTDGVGIFMERFSNTCREVAQGGRRGALMLTISIKSLDIETFINIKRDLKKVTGANVSIKLTDDFMKAVKDDTDFTLQWPVDVPVEEALSTRVVKAKDIWNQIVDAAWTSAEPGLLFWDTVKTLTPTEAYASKGYASTSVNPCGELVLSPYDSCRLLLVNLTKFVSTPFAKTASFDFERFSEVTIKAQRLMDDLVDLEMEAVDKILAKIKSDPESNSVKQQEADLWLKIKNATSGGRRTGLGVTGLGDALAYVNIRYGSQASVEQTSNIYKSLSHSAYQSSIIMAKERGSFPVYDFELEKNSKFLCRLMTEMPVSVVNEWKQYGRRNIALTTTAPAGSVSCLTQTTSGIEPAYLLAYTRRKKITAESGDVSVDFIDPMGDKWHEFKVYHHGFKKWMEVTGNSEENIKESPYWGATSNDVDWKMSVALQSAAQYYVCHSLSKTCNLPNDATRELVSEIYMSAWESGCKGFTVYRDGCRSGVLIKNEEKSTEEASIQPVEVIENHAPKRPKELPCDIHRINVRCSEGTESYLVLVGKLAGRPYEVFCGVSAHVEVPRKSKVGTLIKNVKKSGMATYNLSIPIGDDDCLLFKDVVNLFDNPNHGAHTRTVSLALRHGIPISFVCEQLRKDKHSDMQSFSSVLSRVLKGYIPDGTVSASDKTCPSCGVDGLIYIEGCVSCVSCSYSRCG